ncbi:protein kinase [Maioricimonas sp. JC845]|uniref:WD40 repeat domain-containing serine/threonine protein kinase n=1 Tax=Maioricimonas sp. JC845 TaxID=3232138 RepID=UPI0034578C55
MVCPNCGLVHIPSNLDATSLDTRVAQPPPDEQIAHFRLLKPLGQGAFGTVWLALDAILGRNVALKIPVPRDREATALLHEAQAAATLKHPNIVSVYEVGETNGQVFIASEYIDGPTLQEVLKNGVPDRAKSVDWLIAVSRALHHAHEQGIVHRDVKPGNILINTQGQPFVTDFGLAKRISSDETISSEGHVMGTARYMSPEQASGWTTATDQRSDIYAIGVILFEMLTGFTPFRGNIRAVLMQKTTEDAPSPRKLSPQVDRDLETICLKCLERDPGRRYQTAAEVADELERFQQGKPIHARPISSLARGWRWCKRRPAIAGLLAGLILSLTVGLVSVSFYYRQAQQSARLALESLYRSRMNLVSELMDNGDHQGLARTLDSVAADPVMAPLRGFEWYYSRNALEPFVQFANLGEIVRDVAISPDGTYFAACGNSRQAVVWSTETGERVATISIERGRIPTLDFSPANGWLATGAADGWIRLWNVEEPNTPACEPVKHGPPVVRVRYSPDGSQLAVLGIRGAARIFRGDDLTLVQEIPTGRSGAVDIRFLPDGASLLVVSSDGLMRVWDIASRQQIRTMQGSGLITASAVSDDGSVLVTGSAGGNVVFWGDGDSPTVTYDAVWRIGDLEFLSNSPLLAIVESDGQLRTYNTDERLEVFKLKTHALSSGVLARSADGRFLVVGSGDGSVKVMRTESVSHPDIFWQGSEVRDLEFLPGGSELVAGSGDGELRVWNLNAGASTTLVTPEDDTTGISTLSVQPGGRLLAVAGRGPSLALFDYRLRQPVREIELKAAGVASVQFSPDGKLLAVATREGPLLIYDVENWEQPVVSIENPDDVFTAIAFSPDSRQLAVSREGAASVQLVDTKSGTTRVLPLSLKSSPRALTFDRSGELLIVGTDSGAIQVWDLAVGEVRHDLRGHTGRVSALAVLPSGTTLVSGGRDYTLKLWDLVSGEQVTTLYGHQKQVFSIAVSPDGTTIASGGLLGDIRLWRGGGAE